MPELVCGKKRFYCTTSSNVPFIYTVSYLEERRKRRNLRLEGSLSGATRPKASPASSSSKPSLADAGLEKGEDSDTESDGDSDEVAIAPDDILQKMSEPMRPRSASLGPPDILMDPKKVVQDHLEDVSDSANPKTARTRRGRGQSRG